MTKLPQAKTPNQQPSLPLDHAPEEIRKHGLRAAHRRPLVSYGKQRGKGFTSHHTSPARAWYYPELQYGDAGSSIAAIILDCDKVRQMRQARAEMPPPNVVVHRLRNQHAHVVYCLASPVHRYAAARPGPLRLLSTVTDFLTMEYGADPGFTGLLAHNPAPIMKTPGFKTEWGREAPYTLDELHSLIPFNWEAPEVRQHAIGRNCDLFLALCKWAGREANAGIAVMTAALILNQSFAYPLPISEVAATAKSVEKCRRRWAANGWHCPKWIARQAARGRMSGEARRGKVAARDQLVVEAVATGVSMRQVAKDFGMTEGNVRRIVNRDASLLRGA